MTKKIRWNGFILAGVVVAQCCFYQALVATDCAHTITIDIVCPLPNDSLGNFIREDCGQFPQEEEIPTNPQDMGTPACHTGQVSPTFFIGAFGFAHVSECNTESQKTWTQISVPCYTVKRCDWINGECKPDGSTLQVKNYIRQDKEC